MADPYTREKVFTNAEQTEWVVKHYKDGILEREDPYVAGALSGIARVYAPTGEVIREVPFVKGQMSGTIKQYSGGVVTREAVFERGQPKRG